ncbi:hypothetical protein FJ970_28955 [Mesorhizobium sp. B2-1-8]|uniref:hypothetical protein n=1 Tax=unclassified Mesorhizobium TaxID=325217 RepID=UPI00112A5401|nr:MULTISPECIES: hypothetical protein [unclassified Mesorhizobium]MBZ9668559.1 hypothetical protein [Mesorhizobium sp. ES1-3]MBZ9709694.1 hypothetical protein [Mesorhizobium sp. ESP7-2]UCI19018.1 hypothetical protein FJ970_28955 [Mesorhizobium sp. B2-1-8]
MELRLSLADRFVFQHGHGPGAIQSGTPACHIAAPGTIFGTVLGLMGGFAMAAVVCGKPATLLLIENHLYNLLAVVERNRAPKEI